MFTNNPPWAGLESLAKESDLTRFCFGENRGKKNYFWRLSMQYLIKAYMEDGSMSPNYASWGGVEAY